MNVVPLPTIKTYYVPCNKDSIIIEIPHNYSEIDRENLPKPYLDLDNYVGYIVCPKCKNRLLIDSLESCLNYRSLYLLAKQEQMDQRITQLEYAPPPQGGTEFNEILKEAKDAGDFT